MRLLVAALVLLPLACASGPGTGPAKAADAASGPVVAAPVDEQSFGRSTYRLLLGSRDVRERRGLLIGVTRHQLTRTAERFRKNEAEAGLAALSGAFLLARSGEFHPQMLEGGAPALEAASAEVARLGNDGSALALYSMLLPLLPQGSLRSDVQAHLTAIERFQRETRGPGAVSTAAVAARAAIARAILDTRPAALDNATKTTLAWLRQALATNIGEAPIRSAQERDEAFEAYRALRAGGYTMAALYLRHRDARGALSVLDAAGLERLMAPELRDRLERAADDDDAAAWADLYQFFESARDGSDGLLPQALVDAAAFGAAQSLFQAEPGSVRAALPLAAELTRHGMAEVAPLVLGPALSEAPSPEALSAGLAFVLRAVVTEEDAGGLASARATFLNAQPMLGLAGEAKLRGRVRPSPARLRYAMAAIEIRHGELERARPLLLSALSEESNGETHMTLVAIDRQRGALKEALGWAEKSVQLAREAGDMLAEAEAQIARFEIYREQRSAAEAAKALEAALTRVLAVQRQSRGGAQQARAERLLARVLEYYGEQRAVRRATERAFEAAGTDQRQLTATVMDAARRGITLSDLLVARTALEKALEAGLSDEDLVYPALWLQLVEKKLRVPSSGAAEEAYASIEDAASWPARLRAWATGKISDAELQAAAKGAAQRTEALFYVAMARHVQGKDDAKAGLEQVAKSEAIDLVEVAIARDLLARPDNKFKLPANVVVP
jgi:hypothetical protein